MEIPAGVDLEGEGKQSSRHLLKLNKSLYGLKQGKLNWYITLKTALLDRNFVESISDPCVFMSKDMFILVYVDGCILILKGTNPIKSFVKCLESGLDNFAFTEEKTLDSYLGVNISKLPSNKEFPMSQPFLIARIIKSLNFDSITTKSARDNVTVFYPLPNKDVDGPVRKTKRKCRGIIDMLGYLQGTTCPDISMPTHQYTRFKNDRKLSHERAVKKVVRYLLDSRAKGTIFQSDLFKGLECFVDAGFAYGWRD